MESNVKLKEIKLLYKHCFLILLLLFISLKTSSQNNWKYSCQTNIGCNLTFYKGKGQAFPGLKFFIGISVNSVFKSSLLINYSASIGVYTKSLGNNLNPLLNDIQLDFTNSFMGGYVWGDTTSYTKYFKTLNNVPYYSMFIQKENAVYLGTNLVFNNHKRNQAIGSIGLNIQQISANYSNDGAPPFSWFGLGDSFDRWWTGHGCLYYHSQNNFNYAELGFDQFTGYSPLLYELSGILGINIPDYNIDYKTDSLKTTKNKNLHNRYDYNSSTYSLRINFDKNYGVDLGFIGSLKSTYDRYYAFQELIHMAQGIPFHPNQDANRFFIGPNYRYTSYVK